MRIVYTRTIKTKFSERAEGFEWRFLIAAGKDTQVKEGAQLTFRRLCFALLGVMLE